MPRTKKLNVEDVTVRLARLYAKWFADDTDPELNLSIETLEDTIKTALPREYKKIERDATNLSLGA